MDKDATLDTTDGAPEPQPRPWPAALAALSAMGPARLAVIGGVSLAMLAFLAYLALRAVEAPYTLLFGGLDLEDSARVVDQLESMGVRYRLGEGGAAVLVPRDQALRLRMRLAEEGLPRGGSVGYEIFDQSSPLGTTSFLANVNLLRALEGELARTIRAIDGVQAARVHLVQPRREAFRREQVEPSASIVLAMQGGRRLAQRQVQAVRHLVAAAVPGLPPERVTVVDDQGTLLARGGEGEGTAGLPLHVEEMRTAYELRLKRTIEELLERSLGPGRVRAEVRASMDFDQVSTTSESFDPDSQVARSTQFVEEEVERAEQGRDDAVTVTRNLPTEDGAAGGASQSSERTLRTEETTNFEISRTVRNHTQIGGRLERLSVAVLVDGSYTPGEAGELLYAPRGEAELAQIEALVRSAVGFDAERGDSLEVINMRFTAPEPIADETAWLGLERHDWLRILEILVLAGIAALAILWVVRPTLQRLMPPPPPRPALPAPTGGEGAAGGPGSRGELVPAGDAEDAEDDESWLDLKKVRGQVRASLVNQVGEIVKAKPDEAVRVIRSWLHES